MLHNEDMGFLIQLISNLLRKAANHELEANGITIRQGRVLGYLHEREGLVTTQKDIQEHFEITHPTAVGIIKRLEQKELIRTRTDERDRRVKIVELDEKEESLHRRMIGLKEKMENRLSAGLSEGERAELTRLLVRIHDNLKE